MDETANIRQRTPLASDIWDANCTSRIPRPHDLSIQSRDPNLRLRLNATSCCPNTNVLARQSQLTIPTSSSHPSAQFSTVGSTTSVQPRLQTVSARRLKSQEPSTTNLLLRHQRQTLADTGGAQGTPDLYSSKSRPHLQIQPTSFSLSKPTGRQNPPHSISGFSQSDNLSEYSLTALIRPPSPTLSHQQQLESLFAELRCDQSNSLYMAEIQAPAKASWSSHPSWNQNVLKPRNIFFRYSDDFRDDMDDNQKKKILKSLFLDEFPEPVVEELLASLKPSYENKAQVKEILMKHFFPSKQSFDSYSILPPPGTLKQIGYSENAGVGMNQTNDSSNDQPHEPNEQQLALRENGFTAVTNQADTSICTRVDKRVEQTFSWAHTQPNGTQNTCLPPGRESTESERHSSCLDQEPQSGSKRDKRSKPATSTKTASSQQQPVMSSHEQHFDSVDYSYTVTIVPQPEKEIGNGEDWSTKNFSRLPVFCSSKDEFFENGGPTYLYIKTVPTGRDMDEAADRLALITAGALHDRLLLRYGALEAGQKTFDIDKDLAIYGIVISKQEYRIHKMSVYSPTETQKPSTLAGYYFCQVANSRFSGSPSVSLLRKWLNTIHLFGLTKYAPAVYADSRDSYWGKKDDREEWMKRGIRFQHGAQPNTMTVVGKP
ncbi:MAG: hypothetical protein Q9225_005801 [Loekoesia sp. 1 TL-2023]